MKNSKTLCQIDEIGLSCVACCANINGDRYQLLKDIRKNTIEYSLNHERLNCIENKFDHYPYDINLCFLVFLDKDEKRVGCALHPLYNQGCDLRKHYNICNYKYECDTNLLFQKLPKQEQESIIRGLSHEYKDDWIRYSIDMGDDAILSKFLNGE